MLTSGTTGPPHRVDLTYETLERVMEGAKHYESNATRRAPAPRRRGRGQLADGAPRRAVPRPPIGDGRPRSSLCSSASRSSVGRLRATARSRETVSLVPAALRMVYDADLDPADFASVQSVVSGTAPLIPNSPRPSPRSTGCPCSRRTRRPSSAGASPAGTCPTTSSSRRDEARQRRSGPRRVRAAGRRPERRPPVPDGEVGLLEVKAEQIDRRPVGAHHRPRRASTTTASSGSSGAPTRRSCAAASRCSPRWCGPCSMQHPAVRAAVVFGIDDARLGPGSGGGRRTRRPAATRHRRDSSRTRASDSRATRSPSPFSSWTRCRVRRRQRSTLAGTCAIGSWLPM